MNLKNVCAFAGFLVTLMTPYAIAAAPIFVDVTHEVGIHFQHGGGSQRSSLLPEDMGSGAAFTDIDNDGNLDVYLVNIPGPFGKHTRQIHVNALYHNNGDGTFTDITATAFKAQNTNVGYGMGCVSADYDGDGDADIYITNYGTNTLYRNNGDRSFTDVTHIAGVGGKSWSTGAAFADIDADGDLDIYVCNYVTYNLQKLEQMKAESIQSGKPVPNALNPHVFEPQDNVLYRNNGDGTFTDVTTEAGVAAAGGRSMQAIFSDFDLDNDMDLYVANDTTVNHTYRNNGDGTFIDVSDDSWAADFRGSMGLTAGDYDNDNDIDIFMSHWIDEENALYRNLLIETSQSEGLTIQNRKRIRFVDESYSAMLAEASIKEIGWGTSLFDYDNDGDLDIFVTNGSTFQKLEQPEYLIPQKDALFRNDGNGTFTDVSDRVGIATLPVRVGRGAAFGDYDNDGDIDIFIVNNHAQPTLLRNQTIRPGESDTNTNRWLHVNLRGIDANTNAIGAKIQIKTENTSQIREIYAGESYMSCNSYTVEFGLGTAAEVKVLQVTWPNGKIQTLHNIPVNQRIDISYEN